MTCKLLAVLFAAFVLDHWGSLIFSFWVCLVLGCFVFNCGY